MAGENRRQDKLQDLYYELDKKVAVMSTTLDTVNDKQSDMGADVKAVAEKLSNLSVVSHADFMTHVKAATERNDSQDDRMDDLQTQIDDLRRNTGFFVKIKSKLGDQLTNILIIIILALIAFAIFSLLGQSAINRLIGA